MYTYYVLKTTRAVEFCMVLQNYYQNDFYFKYYTYAYIILSNIKTLKTSNAAYKYKDLIIHRMSAARTIGAHYMKNKCIFILINVENKLIDVVKLLRYSKKLKITKPRFKAVTIGKRVRKAVDKKVILQTNV